jgi:anaerobic selenocysteine-containing dehydrogenase
MAGPSDPKDTRTSFAKAVAAVTIVQSICRCCTAGCGVLIELEGSDVVDVRGDRDHPLSHGYLCPKGTNLAWSHHRPDRLNDPVLHGKTVDWPTLLDDLADTLRDIVQRYGPNAVGVYEGNGVVTDVIGRSTLARFLTMLGSNQDYSAASIDIVPVWRMAEMITGTRRLIPGWQPEDSGSRFVVWIGANPMVSHGHLPDPIRRMRRFVARGGRAWTVDPRATRTTKVARHLPIRPGTDVYLLAWLVKDQFERTLSDQFLQNTTESQRTRLATLVNRFDLGTTARLTGLPESDLATFLTELQDAGRVAIVMGTGVRFDRHAMITDWLRWVLLSMTDSLDREGGMRFSPGWKDPLELRQTSFALIPEGLGPASRPELSRVFDEMPVVAMPDEIKAGNLRALIVHGGNPVSAFPAVADTVAVLKSLDVLVVADILPSKVTSVATHVLAVTGQLERTDFLQYTRVIHVPPVVRPVDNRKPMWWIMAHVARRMGMDVLYGHDPDEIDELDLAPFTMAGGRDSAEDVLAAGTYGLPMPRPVEYVHELLPDKRWNIIPAEMMQRLEALLAESPAVRPDRPFLFTSGRQLTRNNSVDYLPPGRRRDHPTVAMSPGDAERLGIADGELVHICSDNGVLLAHCQMSATMRPGAVSVAHGWSEHNVSVLTSRTTDIDPITGQPVMSAIPVAITKAPKLVSEP